VSGRKKYRRGIWGGWGVEGEGGEERGGGESDGVEIAVDWGAAREKQGMGDQPETAGFSHSVGEHVLRRSRELEVDI
jgi:hypothetical protein